MEYSGYLHLRRLLSVEGIGPVKIRGLLAKFGALENIFTASLHELTQIEGIYTNLAKRIIQSADSLSEIERLVDSDFRLIDSSGAIILPYWDERFPEALKNIYDPPLLLFVKGSVDVLTENGVAIVGTRKPTQYGKIICSRVAKELTEAGVHVISGLARGIDTLAHGACLQAGGKTIAIMGTGIDAVYPAENKRLAEQIAESGLLVSEYFPKTLPEPGNFPRRNRIISGLSKAVMVIETGLTGGAMITANLAADQGRDVYAIPGNLGSPQSEGTNQLIKIGGAKLYNNIDDVLFDMGLGKMQESKAKEHKVALQSLTLFEQKIHSVLNNEPMPIDKISMVTGLPVSDCLVNLLSLEFKGLVRQLPGKMFIAE